MKDTIRLGLTNCDPVLYSAGHLKIKSVVYQRAVFPQST